MMKQKVLTTILLMMLAIAFLGIFVKIEPANAVWENYEIYGGCDAEALGYSNNRLSFHARGYHFVIFSDWQNYCVKYASSPDGETYTVKETLLSEYTMWGFSIWLDVVANTVYWIHNGEGGYYSHYLNLTKGAVNTGGTISFGSPIQICYDASLFWVPESICKLSSGRLVVTYVRSPTGGQGKVYSKYSDDDGATWSPSGDGTLIAESLNWSGTATCLPLTSTAVYIIYRHVYAFTSSTCGKTLDGVSVGAEEAIEGETTKSKRSCGMATLDGKIHILLSRSNYIYHRIRSAGLSGTWNDWVNIETLTNISYSPVPITRNENGMRLYYVDEDGSHNTLLYYRDYDGTNWGDEVLLGQIDDYVADKTFDYSLNTNYAYDLEGDHNIFWLNYWDFGDYYDRLMTGHFFPSPLSEYLVNVYASPSGVGSVSFTINGSSHSTPYSENLTVGSYIFMRSQATKTISSTVIYGFEKWMVTNSSGTFNFTTASITLDIQTATNLTLVYSTVQINIASSPEIHAGFKVDGTYSFVTPKTLYRNKATYSFSVPNIIITVNNTDYVFMGWKVNDIEYTTQLITIQVTGDTDILIEYVEVGFPPYKPPWPSPKPPPCAENFYLFIFAAIMLICIWAVSEMYKTQWLILFPGVAILAYALWVVLNGIECNTHWRWMIVVGIVAVLYGIYRARRR